MLRALLILCAAVACSKVEPKASPGQTERPTTRPSGTPIKFEKTLQGYDLKGVPLAGEIHYAVDLEAPQGKLSKASGTAQLSCKGCSLGDGVAKYVPDLPQRATGRAAAFANQGITIPTIALGDVQGEIRFVDGKGKASIKVEGQHDLKLGLTGEVTLADDVGESRLQLELTLEPRDSLAEQARNLLMLLPGGDQTIARVPIRGSLDDPRMHPKRKSPGAPTMPSLQPTMEGRPHPQSGLGSGTSSAPALPVKALSSAELRKGIKRKKNGVVTINANIVDAVLDNPTSIASGTRIVPSIKNGKSNGLKLYAIQKGSIFQLLGFENGDTILSINGFSLISPDKALEAYTKVRDASTFDIALRRRGKDEALRFEIVR